jgi:hypothetical protein
VEGGTVSDTQTDAVRATRIREILDDLVRQRQSLHDSTSGDERSLLEANRRSIVYWQTELSRALVDHHRPPRAAA